MGWLAGIQEESGPGWAAAPGTGSLPALLARLGLGTPPPLRLPLWVQPVGASARLGLQGREGKELRPGLPSWPLIRADSGHRGCSQWEGPHQGERARAAAPEPHRGATPSHERQDAESTMPCHHARPDGPAGACGQVPGTRHHSPSGTARLCSRRPPFTHRRKGWLRALTRPGTQPQTHAVLQRHTSASSLLLLGAAKGP